LAQARNGSSGDIHTRVGIAMGSVAAAAPHERQQVAPSSDEESVGTCCFGRNEDDYDAKIPIGSAPAYIRTGFVRKVYSLLVVQLLLTFMIALPFKQMSTAWVMSHLWLYKLAVFGSLGLVVGVVCCCQQAARTYPTNYMFLLLVTVCQAVAVGFITTRYSSNAVLLALAATVVVFCGLTLYACFTKSDFTGFGPYLFAALWGMISMSLVLMIFSMYMPIPATADKLFAVLGVILFSFYVVYDTQLIIGGDHKQHQFSVDDYVFAALNIYLDIINMFIYFLRIFGSRD